jgi:hypothetical protein
MSEMEDNASSFGPLAKCARIRSNAVGFTTLPRRASLGSILLLFLAGKFMGVNRRSQDGIG